MTRRPASVLIAVVLVIAASVTLQSGSALAVRLFARCGPGGTVFLRLALATVVLVAMARPRLGDLGREQWRAALILGATLAAMNSCFYQAIARIPLGVAVTIELAGPLAVAALATRRAIDAAWVAIAVGGILLLSPLAGSHATRLDATGVVFAALAACCWAVYIFANAHAGDVFAAGPGVGAGLAVTLGVSTLLVAPFDVPAAGSRLLSWPVLGIGLAVALLCSAIPYTLELHALRTLPRRTFGVLMSLEPALAAISGLVVLHQHLRGADELAIALVIAASAGAAATARSRAIPAAPSPD